MSVVMGNKAATGCGMVAIHCWFAGGEGWAYHPWYEDRKHELLAALKGELESRRELESSDRRRRFVQKAMGGVLFGEQVSDASCPDQAATGRHPTILRVVFLRSEPPELDRVAIAERLSRLDAKQAGPDPGLMIRVNEPRSAHRSPSSRKAHLYIALLGFLCVGAVLAGSQIGLFRPKARPTEDELRKTQAKMATLLDKWQVKDPPQTEGKATETVYTTAQRFLAFLSQKEVGGRLDGHHPDTCFAKRLPQTRVLQFSGTWEG
jgi:hypothetical protein